MTAYAFVWITKYYTDYKHEPVRVLALSSATGHGTNIIAGVSLGLESTALPVLVISIAIISAYWLGNTSGLVDESGSPTGGLFGTAVATMGMLSTAAYVLTMDMFGPIADNAGGIVEMSQQSNPTHQLLCLQPESVREITDVLDAVGNTTKATTKGFAIGSAALASFLLFSAYMDEVASFAHVSFKEVLIAGSMLIFVFSAWACSAVGRTAQEVVNEVRRQFLERPGIMDSSSGYWATILVNRFLERKLLLQCLCLQQWLSSTELGVSYTCRVGDPFKDTAGPSLHVLIKMLATITLVMAPVFL
ncbi:hypothetical protein GW17_00043002 [Ensete ventricosum]|nr:hypothetical protein GW17_00043002 [Ensete ventricosum]